MKAALQLLRHFLDQHPHHAAVALETVPPPEAGAILADQPPDVAILVWQHMAIPSASAALAAMEVPSAVALLCRINAARASLILRRQSVPLANTLIEACPDPWKSALKATRTAGALSVGALMNPTPPAFPADWTVRQTGKFLIDYPEFLRFDIFVVDRNWRLLGRTDLLRLSTHAPARTLSGFMQPDPPHLPLRTSLAAVQEDTLWRTYDVLPVTAPDGYLTGALSHRRLRSLEDHMGKREVEPGTILADAAELALTGYLAAFDVAAALTQTSSPPTSGQPGQPPEITAS